MSRPIAEILPTDPDALRVLVHYGILEVVQDAEDEGDVFYRMIDPEGVRRALDELSLS